MADAKERRIGIGLGLTDHLLALLVFEIMNYGGNRPHGEMAARLRGAGLTLAQAAAVLDLSEAETEAAQAEWDAR